MQILIKIGLNPAELWPKPFLLGQLLFDFPCLLGQLLAGPSIRKPRYQEVFLLCFGGPVFLLCFWDPKVDKLMKFSQILTKNDED